VAAHKTSGSSTKAVELAAGASLKAVRTTVIFPKAMDRNLEICQLKLGLSRNEAIQQALRQFIELQGLDPEKIPRAIDVSY
jgi:hypothetical protein